MPKKLSFVKMQGLGNDFIVVNALKQPFAASPTQITQWCDRHFGVGADQVLVIQPSKKADFKMAIYNADGGEVEMCGNGIRCVADYLVRHGMTKKRKFGIETAAGVMHPQVLQKGVWVDMGEPVLEAEKIPTTRSGHILREPLQISGNTFEVTCVSLGNPHCVIFEEQERQYDVAHWGPQLERHAWFPKRTNVEFVWVVSPKEINVRVWERGAGLTLACGTGACASVVAAVLNKRTQRQVKVNLLGGSLHVEWDKKSNHVWMRGPAQEVFQGEIEI